MIKLQAERSLDGKHSKIGCFLDDNIIGQQIFLPVDEEYQENMVEVVSHIESLVNQTLSAGDNFKRKIDPVPNPDVKPPKPQYFSEGYIKL